MIRVLFFFFLLINSYADEKVKLSNKKSFYNVTSKLDILEDKEKKLNINQIINSTEFKQIDNSVVNLGYSKSAYWFRLKVYNKNRSKPTLMEIPWPHLDYLDIYIFSNKNSGDEESDDLFISYKSGRLIPYTSRNYEHKNFIFKIPNIPSNEEIIIYFRIESDESIIFPVYFYDEMKFFNKDHNEEFIFGIYYGVVLIMFFYNLFIYLSLRDKNYLIYLVYIISLGAYQLSINGIIFSFWPNYTNWNKLFLPLSAAILQFVLIILFKNLLNLKKEFIWEKKAIFILTIMSFLNIIMVLVIEYSYMIVPLNMLSFVYMITSISIVVRAVLKKDRTAIFFLITWIVFLTGGIVLTLRNFNILPQNFFTMYSLQIGSTIEILLLSLALTDRINTMKKELAVLNLNLEEKVEQRTEELSKVLNLLQAKDLTIESELDLASDLQKCIFPNKDLSFPFLNFVGFHEYLMKVGGDFYDLMPLPNDKVGILIADVSGHGIPAALLSTMYKISFIDSCRRNSSPVEIFKEVNKNISNIMDSHDYLTALFIIIDQKGNIQYSSAAHRPAFLFRKKTNELKLITTKGLFLGMLDDANGTYEEKSDKLENGDRILLYTDGIIDAFNQNEKRWSGKELEESFINSSNLEIKDALEKIKSDWRNFRSNKEINDDSTLLLIEFQSSRI